MTDRRGITTPVPERGAGQLTTADSHREFQDNAAQTMYPERDGLLSDIAMKRENDGEPGARLSEAVPRWRQPLKKASRYTSFIRIVAGIWVIITVAFIINWSMVPSSSAEVAPADYNGIDATHDVPVDPNTSLEATYGEDHGSETAEYDNDNDGDDDDANNSAPLDLATSLETIDDGEDEDSDDDQEASEHAEQLDSSYARPALGGKRKAIVTSTWGNRDQTEWIPKLLPDWDLHTYVTDHLDQNENTTLRKMIGREAAVYLTYIVDNYDDLPDYIVFYHGPRYQWHNDDPMLDGYPTIANLSLDLVDEEGYVSLRCDRHVGCAMDPVRPIDGHKDRMFEWSGMYAEIFKHFFRGVPVPKKVQTQCCGQFAVSKAAVQATPLREWRRRRRWLWNSKAGKSSFKVGTSFEYLWHMIFGKPPVHCPKDVGACYCEKWSACDLECKPWMCKGRWWNNPLKKLPKTWPAIEVQGKNGWPVEGWWNYLDKSWRYHPPKNLNKARPPVDGTPNRRREDTGV